VSDDRRIRIGHPPCSESLRLHHGRPQGLRLYELIAYGTADMIALIRSQVRC
jgi:hypothetical protein